MVTLQLTNGKTVAGTVQSSTDDRITFARPGGGTVAVKRSNITNKSSQDMSSMFGVGLLNKNEIRDLMAFLKTLK